MSNVERVHLPSIPHLSPVKVPSFADLQEIIPTWTDLTESRRADMLSAVRTIAKKVIRQPMANIECRIEDLNESLFQQSAAGCGLSISRFQDVLSMMRAILRRLGLHILHPGREALLGQAWQSFLQAIPTPARRAGLRGFARWCDAGGVPPQQRPLSRSAFVSMFMKEISETIGLSVNPHVMRSFAAWSFLKDHPGAYGYRRLTGVLRPDGEPERGLREIDTVQAEIVQGIFRDYSAGISPLMIARCLNQNGVPGPAGAGWNPITIRGTSGKPGGMLRQRLYLGEIVWNRGHRIRDPETGTSYARVNPASEHVISAAPHLRIIDDDLWQKVQERLTEESAPRDGVAGTPRFWEKRRAQHLLSGKLFCGECGGPFSNANSRACSCNNHRRGLCCNKARVQRPKVEARVLDVLAGQMMDPELAALFAEEFALEWNRLAAEADREKGRLRRDLADVEKRLDHLVEAITSGLRSASLQAKLGELETEKERLERELQAAPPGVVRMMPNIGQTYRRTLARLVEALAGAEGGEALNAARALIERVVIHAAPGRTPPGITVEGRFAAMLMAGQPGLSEGMAETIARATMDADKEGLGGQSPPKRPQRAPRILPGQ